MSLSDLVSNLPPGRRDEVRPSVAYIGGYGRSGSTLLLRLLAEAPEVFPIGELVYIWTDGFQKNQLCGCGTPFRECEFWMRVTDRVFGRMITPEEATEIALLQKEVIGPGTYRKIRVRRLQTTTYRNELRSYVNIMAGLYTGIAAASGASLLVDSSKEANFARVLADDPEQIELHMVHLVRDSRATAFSWMRRAKPRTEVHWETKTMDDFGLAEVIYRWVAVNSLLSLDRTRFQTYSLLRYEAFVEDPRGCLGVLGNTWNRPNIADIAVNGTEIRLPLTHTVAGNPDRFISGQIQVQQDSEWKQAMPLFDKAVVTAGTAPLLRRYGYRLGWS